MKGLYSNIKDRIIAASLDQTYHNYVRQKDEWEKKVDIEAKEPHNLESAYMFRGGFGQVKAKLESEGYKIISLEEEAKLRMQEGVYSSISSFCELTREACVIIPNKGVYLTKNSPIMDDAKKATRRGKKNYLFGLTDKQVSKAIETGISINLQDDYYKIPTNKFGEDVLTDFAFGKIAKDYGLFLKEEGIDEIKVDFLGYKDIQCAKQIQSMNFASKFSITNHSLNRCGHYVTRGVRKIETYNTNDISKALKEINFSKLEKVLLEKLNKLSTQIQEVKK